MRRWLLWLLIMTVAVAVGVPVSIRALLLQTEYAPEFRKASFSTIRTGTAIEEVLARLGPPLRCIVISRQTGVTIGSWTYGEDEREVIDLAKKQASICVLHYSKPRHEGGSYRAYEIQCVNGKVRGKRTYNYWD